MLELADVIAHRALAYVTAIERQGYSMTVDELAAYMARPTRRPGKPGTSGKPARTLTTTKVDRAIAEIVANSLQPTMRALGASLAAALDVREQTFDAIPGSPGEPPEPIAEWLSRLGWLKVTQERIGLTKLGRAVLAHLEQESLEDEIPIGIVLNQGDDLAEARVIAHIAGRAGFLRRHRPLLLNGEPAARCLLHGGRDGAGWNRQQEQAGGSRIQPSEAQV